MAGGGFFPFAYYECHFTISDSKLLSHAESSGSGSGDFSGSSGDDGSGSGGASGNGAIEALDESVDDEGSAGPRENTFENGTAETRNASDFDFS